MQKIDHNQRNSKPLIRGDIFFSVAILFLLISSVTYSQTSITPVLSLQDPATNDQDDMCIWIHPDPSLSTVIGSDKAARKLFVYDLNGNTLQTISVPGQPGNIDVRYNFLLSGQLVDIVGYNDRDNSTVVLYKVDPSDRTLVQVANFDAGHWPNEIYGFCLYRSPNNGKHYAIGCGESSQMRQWELVDAGNGTIDGIEKRTWQNGTGDLTEGLVADDETAKLYAANEGLGIYKYDADPDDPNPAGQLIAPTGSNGLTPDVEGITLYYAANGEGYLIASSQGSDNFKVYERKEPHDFVTTFTVHDAGDSDGIDVTNVGLGSMFPDGLFAAHNGSRAIRLCDYADIGLSVDNTYWNPRGNYGPTPSVLVEVKIFLEGPYNSSTGEMSTYLNTYGYIPEASPYSEDPRSITPPFHADITDWILLELRETDIGAAVVSRSALLRKDGRIVGDNGITEQITVGAPPGDYYIVITHRNHLAAMSTGSVPLSSGSATLYDFTSDISQYYDGGAKELTGGSGVWGMYGGNADNSDRDLFASDLAIIKIDFLRGMFGYHLTDVDMDGDVFASDYALGKINFLLGAFSTVP
jgi:3-phytase